MDGRGGNVLRSNHAAESDAVRQNRNVTGFLADACVIHFASHT